VPLYVTINEPNWSRSPADIVVFRVVRAIVLSVAIVVAIGRSRHAGALLAALIFAMIAAAEGFPPAGWLATLRHLPLVLAIPVAIASASWLLIPVAWCCLAAMFPRAVFRQKRLWAIVLAPCVVFVPPIVMSAVALVAAPVGLTMAPPFVYWQAAEKFGSAFGAIPSIFLNWWPPHGQERHMSLLGPWAIVTVIWLIVGAALMMQGALRVTEEPERRRVRQLTFGLSIVVGLGILHELLRAWSGMFGVDPPALVWTINYALQAVGFSVLAMLIGYVILTSTRSTLT